MAAGLPKPINIVLTLWLPPKFEQTDENTLGFILKQDGLTWEKLVVSLNAGIQLTLRTHCISSPSICSFLVLIRTQCRRWQGYICQSLLYPRTLPL